MKYYSTNKQSPVVEFRQAAIMGQAPDKGLYMPETRVVFNEIISQIEDLSDVEIAFRVMRPYVGESIPEEVLFTIVEETLSFSTPLVPVNERIFSLELFHGPTLAFKDIGARFMSRCVGYFVQQGLLPAMKNKRLVVLVATSGDTGGAVANGFFGVEGIDVVILYPSGRVSPVQEQQIAALGKNIHALEVSGTFDDCQQMVKQAFADVQLQEKLFLTSANSINIARWLPQQWYYFFAYRDWPYKDHPPIVSVPSGNFGNLAAGLLAKNSGLPVKRFIAACNSNDVVPDYLRTGKYYPRNAIPTISNAMDVGDPSNFIRILGLSDHWLELLHDRLSADSITDEVTIETINKVQTQYNYQLDPHGTVGYKSLENYLTTHPDSKGIFLATAHPIKFPGISNAKVMMPSSLESIMKSKKKSVKIRNEYVGLRGFLLS